MTVRFIPWGYSEELLILISKWKSGSIRGQLLPSFKLGDVKVIYVKNTDDFLKFVTYNK